MKFLKFNTVFYPDLIQDASCNKFNLYLIYIYAGVDLKWLSLKLIFCTFVQGFSDNVSVIHSQVNIYI